MQVWFSKKTSESSVYIAFALGILFGIGSLLVTATSGNWMDFGAFLILLSVYHLWEWTFVALFHPKELSSDSFLINHSPEWAAAWMICIVEYSIERAFFPFLKGHMILIVPSLLIAILGQGTRTLAMFTAGSNFAHTIEEKARDDHKLVTWGIYSISRHPSYCGWFWWTIATQALLANPIALCGFAVVSWKFFKDRIDYEETLLEEQFGKTYKDYKHSVPVGIPFIH